MTKVIGAVVPARGKSVFMKEVNQSVTTVGGWEVKRRPTSPWSCYCQWDWGWGGGRGSERERKEAGETQRGGKGGMHFC